MYHWKVCVQFLARMVSLEGLCTVSSAECITRNVVFVPSLSVSMEGLCTVSSSECITGRLVLSFWLRMYHWNVCVQSLAQSVSLEGL